MSFEEWRVWSEILSYIVTIVGFPLALATFIYQEQKERQNEEAEIHQRLSDEYVNFLRLALEHADLHLLHGSDDKEYELSEVQKEKKMAIFNILVSIFEKAYILVYEEKMNAQTRRLWQTWEDYIREWCRRRDFAAALPRMLEGEDQEFRSYIFNILKSSQER